MSGIIIVDKPSGWTSQDVCAKLRGVFHERRVGHGGTLDPMATGVLAVFVGRATRAVEYAVGDRKRYTAHIRFGVTTDTLDTQGRVLTSGGGTVTEDALRSVLPRFTGEIEQVPPMYSAVRVGGRRLYALARSGQTVERPPRKVTIYDLTVLGQSDGDYVLDIACSKGTYVRALCADIGEAVGTGAVMSALRRTEAGPFTLSDAHTMDEILSGEDASSLLLPVDSLFAGLPKLTVDPERERRCRNGLAFARNVPDGLYRVYGASGDFLLVGRAENGTVRTVKSFFSAGT